MYITKTSNTAIDPLDDFKKNMDKWDDLDVAFYDQVVDMIEMIGSQIPLPPESDRKSAKLKDIINETLKENKKSINYKRAL